MSPTSCPCGSGQALVQCCGRYHTRIPAPDAEALMRSRYSAYVLGLIDYLVETTLPAQQEQLDRQAITDWSKQSTWLGLQVELHEPLSSGTHAYVSFTATWRDLGGEHQQHERSAFVLNQGRWYFIDPTYALKVGRNDPCPCASGAKFKKCCSILLG